MHNQQDKIWVTSTPSSEEMGKTFHHSFLESPQPMDIWQQKSQQFVNRYGNPINP